MIRAVCFDMGGVILRTTDLGPRRRWEQHFGLPEWGLAEIIFDNPTAQRATMGQATTEEVWAEVARRLALTPEQAAALRRDFWRGDAYDEDLLRFIRALRPRYQTGLISNAWPDAREAVKAHINGEGFDVIVFSAEEGVAKPEPEIFRRALARLEVAPTEAIFVDDMSINVEAARALGMHGVHFTSSADARQEIRRLLDAPARSPADA